MTYLLIFLGILVITFTPIVLCILYGNFKISAKKDLSGENILALLFSFFWILIWLSYFLTKYDSIFKIVLNT